MPFSTHPCLPGRLATAVLLVAMLSAAAAYGQKKEEPPEYPAPKTVVREAADGMLVRCMYYYGGIDPERKKNTVPVMIVHNFKESAADYDGLATMLQKQGHAVIVPELRGHGGSTNHKSGVEYKLDSLEKNFKFGMAGMLLDLEAAKQFLLEENNKGELNIELLTVVGVGDMGSVVALNWVATDWSWPVLPGRKQGQDVKAVALLSPMQSFKGVTAREALLHDFLRNQYLIHSSIALIVGSKDRESSSETRRIYQSLEKFHEINKTLFRVEKDTSLAGVKLLDPRLNLRVDVNIANFIKLCIVNNENEFPWRARVQN